MSETTLPVGSDAPAAAPTERRQGPPITVVMLDDENLILTANKRVLQRATDEVATFYEEEGDSKVNALVTAVREALASGHHVVVLSDGSMPNGTTPVTVSEALAKEQLLATRGAFEEWMESADGEGEVARPAGAPVVVVSGGASNPELATDIEAAVKRGDIVGILGKPFEASQLLELVLGLAISERVVLSRTIEGIAQTFEQAMKK